MSRTRYEGQTKVWFLPAVANKEAPTDAEWAAGTHLSPYLAKDGIQRPGGQNYIDSATIEDVYDAQNVGSWGGAPFNLTMFRDDTDETDSYDLVTYGLEGFLMVSPFGIPANGDQVEIWPVEAHEPVLMQSAANENQKFTAGFAVTAAPALRATLTAS